jgi:cell division protease FtsH
MIMDHGMTEKFRNVVLRNPKAGPLGGPMPESLGPREYSEQTQQYLDEYLATVMRERYERVLRLLRERKTLLLGIAGKLIEKESLTEKEFRELVNQDPALSPAGNMNR